jgi:hypothetical protein
MPYQVAQQTPSMTLKGGMLKIVACKPATRVYTEKCSAGMGLEFGWN